MSRPPQELVKFLAERNIYKGKEIGESPPLMYFEKKKGGKAKSLYMYSIKQVFAMKGWQFPPKDIIWRRYPEKKGKKNEK